MLKRGDVILFKGSGPVFQVLSRLLKLFEPWWDKWGWHMAVAYQKTYHGWYLLEATGKGVEINFYSDKLLRTETRAYRWLDKEPSMDEMSRMLAKFHGKRYDILFYFFSSLGYLIRHYWGRRIPYLFDNRFCCWELVYAVLSALGKPLADKYDFPLITDFLKLKPQGVEHD